VAWVKSNPGRIKSMHLKDWSKAQGYKVLFGEGEVPWKPLLEAAIQTGGAEYFLIEQEGSRYSEFETAKRCLENYKKLMG
jgi:sugar phosphate isomerase/epimerase